MSLRAVLGDPLGLAMLFASIAVSAAMAYLPFLSHLAGRALWVFVLGIVVYAYVAVAILRSESRLPQALREMRNTRDALARLHAELKSTGRPSTRVTLLPVVARALGRLDEEIMPSFKQLLEWNERLDSELEGYRNGSRLSPNAVILQRLRDLFDKQRLTIAESVKQVTDTYATLLLLIHEADEPRVAAIARVLLAEMEDIYGGISEVLGRGIRPPDDEPSPDNGHTLTAIILPVPEGEGLTVDSTAPSSGAPAHRQTSTSGQTREVVQERQPGPPERQFPGGLTAREVEVLRLVCGGLTSKEIAADLVVSITTVHRHIANIYAKIGVGRRHEAVTWALNQGVVKLADLQRPDSLE